MNFFFAAFCLLSPVWTFFFVPEASELTLEQMGHLFRDSTSKAEEARRHVIESELLRGRGVTRLAVAINALYLHVEC
jgi:hypothetical protein